VPVEAAPRLGEIAEKPKAGRLTLDPLKVQRRGPEGYERDPTRTTPPRQQKDLACPTTTNNPIERKELSA
jgi:hypothetical protein